MLSTKRNFSNEYEDDGTVPVMMYGIVTNALQWVFLRWSGFSDKPTIEVSHSYNCSLDGDFDKQVEQQVGKIVGYLISILQSQVVLRTGRPGSTRGEVNDNY